MYLGNMVYIFYMKETNLTHTANTDIQLNNIPFKYCVRSRYHCRSNGLSSGFWQDDDSFAIKTYILKNTRNTMVTFFVFLAFQPRCIFKIELNFYQVRISF